MRRDRSMLQHGTSAGPHSPSRREGHLRAGVIYREPRITRVEAEEGIPLPDANLCRLVDPTDRPGLALIAWARQRGGKPNLDVLIKASARSAPWSPARQAALGPLCQLR